MTTTPPPTRATPMTIQYRYRLPVRDTVYVTQSFGIEPYNVETGRKAGKAVVRLVIYNCSPGSDADAMAVADKITERLNSGGTYGGPKSLHFDWQRKCNLESVEGYL